jgi:hypothetical protein
MRVFVRRFRHYAGLAAITLVLAAVPSTTVILTTAAPADASFGISQRMGVDGCGLNTTARATAFWSGTPYYNFGFYMGGSAAGCPTNSPSFASALVNQGWRLLPIWVGPQAPCSSFGSRMSSDTATAYSQGKGEAVLAYQRLISLGLSTENTPVTYDLEAYNTGNSGCVNAVKSFMQGWVYQLHLPPAQKAGVYGSTCGSGLANFASISPTVDFITGAAWDNNKNTAALPCISSGWWTQNQRHKQYQGGHNETWNGVTIQVDSDCSNGPVYPGPDALSVGQGCV